MAVWRCVKHGVEWSQSVLPKPERCPKSNSTAALYGPRDACVIVLVKK